MTWHLLDMIVQFATLIVCAICVVLVLHPQYNDGFFGRVGLAMVGVASFARAATIISGIHQPVSNIGTLLWIGLALFLARHFRNFYLRKDRIDSDNVTNDSGRSVK